MNDKIMDGAPSRTVWLNEQTLIASFHPEDGYRRYDFRAREAFIRFLQSLQVRGYRFQ